MKQLRSWNIDYLRIMACFMVVFLHVAAQNFSTVEVTSVQWQFFHFYDNAVRSCVPIFFMISGMLFLSRDKSPDLKTLFTKNISKIVILYFVWVVFYAIDFGVIQNKEGLEFLETVYRYILTPKYHLWYMPALISVYFLMPILYVVAHYEDGKYLNYACAMFLLFGVIKNTILLIPMKSIFVFFIEVFKYDLSKYSGYFLIGYWIFKNKDKLLKIKTSTLIILLVCIILGSWYIGLQHALHTNEPSTLLYDNLMLPSCLEAIIIFMLFLRIPNKQLSLKSANFVKYISKYTLFVYLFHVYILNHLHLDLGINTLLCHPMLSVPILSIVIFVLCLIVAYIVDHIPVLRNIFM